MHLILIVMAVGGSYVYKLDGRSGVGFSNKSVSTKCGNLKKIVCMNGYIFETKATRAVKFVEITCMLCSVSKLVLEFCHTHLASLKIKFSVKFEMSMLLEQNVIFKKKSSVYISETNRPELLNLVAILLCSAVWVRVF